jgi:outer membrane protein
VILLLAGIFGTSAFASQLPRENSPLLTASPSLRSVAPSDGPLTLSQAVSIALRTSRSLASAQTAVETARGRTAESRTQLFPSASAGARYQYFDKQTSANFGGGAVTLNPQFNPVYNASIALPIDITGAIHAAVSQSHFEEIATRIDYDRTRNQVVFDVKNAFYSVLRAQAQLGVAVENLNNARERLAFAKKNFSAGTNPKFDVITAERDVAEAQQGWIVAKASVSVNLAALKNVIGVSIQDRVSISSKDSLEVPDEKETGKAEDISVKSSASSLETVPDDFDFGPDYVGYVKEALANRPEVLEGLAEIEAARRGIQYARRSSLPSVNLSLAYVHTPKATLFERVDQDVLTLDLSFPIFDGGLARARIREAKAKVSQAEIAHRQALDLVQVEVQQAYIALVQARQRVAVSHVEVAQADEAYRVARLRYSSGVSLQAGVSPQLELSNVQVTSSQARSNQVNSLYDYNLAKAQLDRALGRYAYRS